jgi:energy-coupling factor transporter ATP-binding protein EcfA2
MPVSPLVDLEGAGTGYAGGPLVLRQLAFAVRAGERVGVLGPNGGGKTTLFRLLLGDLPVREGHVRLRGAVATVPQTERSRLDFPVSALDVVLLFGDILGASNADLALAGGLAALVVLALRLLHWRLLTAGFDPGGARALGASAPAAEAGVLVLLAAAILVAVQGMGNLLVVAVLLAPAATARMLTQRMGPMMVLAAALAAGCGIGGLYASYYLDIAAGAAIALAMVALYALTRSARTLRATARRAPGRRISIA